MPSTAAAGRLQAGRASVIAGRADERGSGRRERTCRDHALVVPARAEIDLNEMRGRLRGSLREEACADRVGARGGLALLGDVPREYGHVGGDPGDLERYLRRALERASELEVARALDQPLGGVP